LHNNQMKFGCRIREEIDRKLNPQITLEPDEIRIRELDLGQCEGMGTRIPASGFKFSKLWHEVHSLCFNPSFS
jgi:hypothetical protein